MDESRETRIELRILERMAADHARGALGSRDGYRAEFSSWPELVDRCFSTFESPTEHVGPYELLRPLGAGGQGRVFLARAAGESTLVAIKLLPGASTTSPDGPGLVQREREVFARVDDDRLAGIVDSGVTDGRTWIATRYVPGTSLANALDGWRRTPVTAPPIADRVAIAAGAASALASAHARAVVHRDIKPSNVILGDDGGVAIIDFGLARVIDTELPSLTRTGDVLGTPAYLSPERLRGEARDDPRTDVWALGVMLFELVTFEPPFRGHTIETMARSIERDEVPRLRRRVDATGTVPDTRLVTDLDAVLAHALAKNPARRFADAGAFAADLGRALRGEAVRARAPSTARRAARWMLHHPTAATLITVLAAASVAAAWAALAFHRVAQDERAARHDALTHLARAELDSGRLELESTRLDRAATAAARFDRAASAIGNLAAAGVTVPSPLRTELRSALTRALSRWSLVARQPLEVGGLGTATVSPNANTIAFYGVSASDRRIHVSLVDTHDGRARGVPFELALDLGALCAIGPAAEQLAFVNGRRVTVVRRSDHATLATVSLERGGSGDGGRVRREVRARGSPPRDCRVGRTRRAVLDPRSGPGAHHPRRNLRGRGRFLRRFARWLARHGAGQRLQRPPHRTVRSTARSHRHVRARTLDLRSARRRRRPHRSRDRVRERSHRAPLERPRVRAL